METSYRFFEETSVPDGELIISRTDLSGKITYANEIFAKISGYEVEELIGKPHSIVRHPDMPKSVFKTLWDTIKQEKLWSGYVKNLRKDGGYYWVYAEVSGVYKDGELVEYKSIRVPISDTIKKLTQEKYDKLKKNEEDKCRIVTYISSNNLEKLERYSKESEINSDNIINKILEDYLL